MSNLVILALYVFKLLHPHRHGQTNRIQLDESCQNFNMDKQSRSESYIPSSFVLLFFQIIVITDGCSSTNGVFKNQNGLNRTDSLKTIVISF